MPFKNGRSLSSPCLERKDWQCCTHIPTWKLLAGAESWASLQLGYGALEVTSVPTLLLTSSSLYSCRCQPGICLFFSGLNRYGSPTVYSQPSSILRSRFPLTGSLFYFTTCVSAKLLRSCLTLQLYGLYNPPGPSVHGIVQAGILG